jgi:hypothetical protein
MRVIWFFRWSIGRCSSSKPHLDQAFCVMGLPLPNLFSFFSYFGPMEFLDWRLDLLRCFGQQLGFRRHRLAYLMISL